MVGVANRDQPPSTSAAEGAAQPRPTITLPPHSSADTFFGGGAPPFAFSPGPMTLVSSLFATDGSGSNNNSDDFRSFSHLLAGAPVQSPLPMFPIYGLLDSPSAFFSSPQGQLGMTHQQTLEQVTAQAEVTSNSTHQIMLPSKPDSVGNSHSEQRLQPPPPPPSSSSYSSVNVDKPNDDGYNWRKYGQKQVKGSEFPRSYYKCTHPKCPVKKKVERSLEGHVTAIIYKGEHNHQCPHPDKITKDSTIANANSNMQGNCDSSVSKMDSGTSDNEEVDDHETEVDGEPDAKRRNTEFRNTDPTSSHRAVTEPRIIVQTTSEVDLLDDGYRWRKYGQKVVKGNPYPRSYYKCTTPSCNVRKHVERASADPKAVITTYEGKHNHDVPAAKSNSHTLANNAASHQLKSQNVMLERHSFGSRGIEGNEPQQPVARLRLKEEQIT